MSWATHSLRGLPGPFVKLRITHRSSNSSLSSLSFPRRLLKEPTCREKATGFFNRPIGALRALAMERGSNALEYDSLVGDGMMSAVQGMAGTGGPQKVEKTSPQRCNMARSFE
jgi:hypothetical protein